MRETKVNIGLSRYKPGNKRKREWKNVSTVFPTTPDDPDLRRMVTEWAASNHSGWNMEGYAIDPDREDQ